MMDRRIFLTALAGAIASASSALAVTPTPTGGQMRVVRSPDCGCCGAWIAHLQDHGFVIEEVLSDDVEAEKDLHAIPGHLRSCHTGFIDGYIIEGHVPANDIQRLLNERPQADGLAVPGMPLGSPGMEMGDHIDAYDVVLWSGSDTQIFSTY